MRSASFALIALVLLHAPASRAQDAASPPSDAPQEAVNYNPLIGSVVPRGVPYQPLSGRDRWRVYAANSILTPMVAVRALIPAALDQYQKDPRGWTLGAKGFAARAGNRAARFSMQDGIEAAGSAAMGLEARYIFCECKGGAARAGHAVLMNFITYNSKGRYAPHIPRIGGAFAAEFIGNQWLPPNERKVSTALAGIGLQIGIMAGVNLVREFSPEWKRFLKRRK